MEVPVSGEGVGWPEIRYRENDREGVRVGGVMDGVGTLVPGWGGGGGGG